MKRHYLAITIKNTIYINFITVFIFQFFFFITSSYSESLTSWDNMDLKNSYIIFKQKDSYYFFANDRLINKSPLERIENFNIKFYSNKNEIQNLEFCNNEKKNLNLIKEINIYKTNSIHGVIIDVPKSSCLIVKIISNYDINYNYNNNYFNKKILCSRFVFKEKKLNFMLRRKLYLNCIKK